MSLSRKAPVELPEDGWHPARLIPTTGIGGEEDQEQRATSSLLAVMRAVPEFGRALLAPLGAPPGRITTYTEVPLPDLAEKKWRPDGVIVVERGKVRWSCLVEVKTGGHPLRVEQVTAYLDLARQHGFDAVLTISNAITSSSAQSPVTVDAKRLKRTPLRHLSWLDVLTQAIIQTQHRAVSDPDQAWILGELVAYLDNARSGAGGFDDMGDKWVAVRDGVRQQTLRASDPGVRDVASKWEQFVQALCLGLRQDLGRDVSPVWPKTMDASARLEERITTLAETGKLTASIRVPDAIGPVVIEADLRTRLLTTSAEVAAPREGRAKTRVTWLLRQLKDSPPLLRIDVRFPLIKDSTSALLKEALEKPERLLLLADPKREPRTFKLALSREIGTKRGKGQGSFVLESRKQTIEFYRSVVQQLRAWSAQAPKLPDRPNEGDDVASPQPPDFTAVDARDAGEGVDTEPDDRTATSDS
jgi:hypothetical protein